MATGGVSPRGSDKTFKVSSDVLVTVTKDDIFKTTAGAIVVGEDAGLRGGGGVSKHLLDMSPKEFGKLRDKLRSDNGHLLQHGKVYVCSVPSSLKPKHKVNFRSVYYGIVPPKMSSISTGQWGQTMKGLYYKAMRQADEDDLRSLAVPILGSGGAGATFDEATDVLVEALTTFQFKNGKRQKLQEVFVHCHEKEAYKKMVDKLGNDRSVRPVSPGASSASGAFAAKSSGSTKSAKSGSARPTSGNAASVGASSRNTYPGRPGSAGKSASKSKYTTVSSTSVLSKSGASKSLSALSATAKSSGMKNGPVSGGASGAAAFDDDDDDDDDDSISNISVILGKTTLAAQDAARKKREEKKEEERMEIDDDEECVQDEEDETDEEATEEKIEEKKKVVEEEEEEDRCPICLDEMTDPKKLDKCGHTFCRECIEDSFLHHKPACPTCNTMYGLIKGNQPPGSMNVDKQHSIHLPGFQNYGTIVIDYLFPNGIQGKEHPNPGQPFHGTHRRAFLPDSDEGRKVCRLLRVAFDNRLTFTVGRSVTTGADNVVTWNDIHHKTSIDGGPTGFGFPDPHYLSRVQEELAAKGVTAASLEGRSRFDV